MKRIVIRNISSDLQELISARMKDENCGPSKAVVAILKDAAIEKMVENDMASLRKSWSDDAIEAAQTDCCGRVHITVNCNQHR